MAFHANKGIGQAISTDTALQSRLTLPNEERVVSFRDHHHHHRRKTLTFGRVSKRAVLSSKRKIWDSNDASIDAAQSAVDHWENAYNAMRALLMAGVHGAQGLYGAAKVGVVGIEHGFLVPVRDWVLLPAFYGVEHGYSQTVHFLQSPQAEELARNSLDLVRKFPFLGEPFLAPALVQSYMLMIRAWEIAQYPIPSKADVRESVDYVLTMTKWALSRGSSEVQFYIKRLDANITRTLMHTQWRVLKSGPYATLDKLHKVEVLDHLCERYLGLDNDVARYEFAAHIRAQNPQLYKDLVLSGLLRERGGAATKYDEWLAIEPRYWPSSGMSDLPFLTQELSKVAPLYFRLPYINGERPHKDVPWRRFPEPERRALEKRFHQFCREQNFKSIQSDYAPPPSPRAYPTTSQWYRPQINRDVLVDQKRHAVSFFTCCPRCRRPSTPPSSPMFCPDCAVHTKPEEISLYAPPVTMIVRPTLWRFHGSGDEVRRATWFLDTKWYGLQPYSDESAAVLEDAFWFLKWKPNHDNAVLTVQVTSPDGSEQQLVQFSSLFQVTAIQKTLGGAISLFKRRVYRGVSMEHAKQEKTPDTEELEISFQEEDDDGEIDDLWVECANEPPAIVDDDGEALVDFDSLSVHKERRDFLFYNQDTLLALPTAELDLEDEMRKAAHQEDVDHLVLIVHGIGEMLRSTDFFGINIPNLSSIIECCGYLRKNHTEVGKAQTSLSSVNGRVEYLPVEWHDAFSLQSQRGPKSSVRSFADPGSSSHTMMHDISLRTIPQMRAFANDTLMDVLYFMSPQHHDLIIDIVTNEMNVVVQKFRDLTGFEGDVSVIGHSLGSIITWDILDHQVDPTPGYGSCVPDMLSGRPNVSYRSDISDSPSTRYPQLSFRAQNAFFLGSPIAVFLMIRNQHAPLTSDFHLAGCKNVFNIFHPYDPVAYRIEPLIDNMNAEFEPRIVTHWNGGFRVQYQTKRMWKRIVDETMRTQQHVIEVVEASMTGLGLLDTSMDYMGDEDDEISDSSASVEHMPRRPTCGSLNQGRRIDYMLQEKEIETANEYVAALNAHSAYWSEKDLSLFVARQIVRSSLESAIRNSEDPDYYGESPQHSVETR